MPVSLRISSATWTCNARWALRIEALRGDVRQTLAKVSPRLGQLAALDAVLEQMLGSREQGLMGTVPVVLERQFENRRAAHRQAQDATQPTDDPALLEATGQCGCTALPGTWKRRCWRSWRSGCSRSRE
jgi:hypothetical protein